MTVKEIRTLDADAIRAVCIRNEYFTRGNNSDYDYLLHMAEDENVTTELLADVAFFIFTHSDGYGKEYFENILFNLAKACTVTFEIAP